MCRFLSRSMSDNLSKSQQFHALYENNRRRLFRFALSYLRDEVVAEDIVMDGFMHYWEHRDSIREDTSPLPYILTTVRNGCLNHLKAQLVRQRARNELYDTNSRIVELQIQSITACDPTELFTEESRHIVARAVSELPGQTREVLLRSMFQEQPYKQIMAEMNLSFGTVDHEIRRAKKILAKKLKMYHPDLLTVLVFWVLQC